MTLGQYVFNTTDKDCFPAERESHSNHGFGIVSVNWFNASFL